VSDYILLYYFAEKHSILNLPARIASPILRVPAERNAREHEARPPAIYTHKLRCRVVYSRIKVYIYYILIAGAWFYYDF